MENTGTGCILEPPESEWLSTPGRASTLSSRPATAKLCRKKAGDATTYWWLSPCFSKCRLQASGASNTWKPVRNTDAQARQPQTYRIRICILTRWFIQAHATVCRALQQSISLVWVRFSLTVRGCRNWSQIPLSSVCMSLCSPIKRQTVFSHPFELESFFHPFESGCFVSCFEQQIVQ